MQEMPKDCADEDDLLNKKARYLIAFAKLLMFPNKDHWDGSLNVELFKYNMQQFFVNGIVLGHITKEVVFLNCYKSNLNKQNLS